MKIILDERESFLYADCLKLLGNGDENGNSPFPNIHLSKEVLPLGDILLKTDEDVSLLLIERKSIGDLLASIKDGRYEEQSYRLMNSEEFPSRQSIIYIIEGMFTYHKERKTVLSAITSLQFFKGFSVIRTCSLLETAEYIIHMADKIERDFNKGKILAFSMGTENPVPSYSTVVKKIKKDNITAQNMGEILLSQIPGISANAAIAILKHTNGSFLQLLETLKTDSSSLETIMIGGGTGEKKGRKISKTIILKMKELLLV
jgi:crossover junction endonuclease MUS81